MKNLYMIHDHVPTKTTQQAKAILVFMYCYHQSDFKKSHWRLSNSHETIDKGTILQDHSHWFATFIDRCIFIVIQSFWSSIIESHMWVSNMNVEINRRTILLGFSHIDSLNLINSLWPGDAIWRHGTRSILTQVMACCLTAPSHYLKQCWLIIGEVPWH